MVANIIVRPRAELDVSMTVCPKSNQSLGNRREVHGSKSYVFSTCFKMSERIMISSVVFKTLVGMKENMLSMFIRF